MDVADIERLFDEHGRLTFDPYRTGDDEDLLRQRSVLFCDDGYLLYGAAAVLKKLVEKNGWSRWCDAVGLVHADRFAMNTKDHYPTVYFFR